MSKGSRIPALPPKSGCRVCGAAHFTLCPGCAESIGERPVYVVSPTCLRCGCDRHGYGSAHLCAACLAPEATVRDVGYNERLSAAVNADQDDTNARARRRMGVGR